jgi:hypothetical protein
MPLFETIFDRLKHREPLAPLFPQAVWDGELSRQLITAADAELFGEVRDAQMASACRSGLLLWNDDLKASHDLAQHIGTPTGSLWHAVNHRREADASNSSYWWRQTGLHPALNDIYTEAMSSLENETAPEALAYKEKLHRAGHWEPREFVQLCDSSYTNAADWILHLQRAEFIALLQWNREQV